MSARFYFTNDVMLLKPDYIPTLAAAAFKGAFDVAALQGHVDKQGTLVLPNDQFLVLVGTTDELKKFRAELNEAGVKAIGCGQYRLSGVSPLVAWCARVDTSHPDKMQLHDATVTLVVLCRENLWVGSNLAKPPWYDFPNLFGAVSLDDIFDSALDLAKNHPKAN